jgi:NTP pyrophosphatase (non-canonical NTP hydrolase)
MAQLTEEVGEVARITPVVTVNNQRKKVIKQRSWEELADVVLWLCLANQTGIDLQAAFDKKMDLNRYEIRIVTKQ